MKKQLFTALLCIIGLSAVFAQQKDSIDVSPKFRQKWGHFFVSAGYVSKNYKLNDKLKLNGLPEINNGAFELGIGLTQMGNSFLSDLEWDTDYYSDKKASGIKIRTLNSGIKWRPQYIFYYKKGMLAAVGLDLSFFYNSVNIFDPSSTVDLNNLSFANARNISLYNYSWYLGPSASFGLWQNKNSSLRLTTGYEWNIARASWHSEYASVSNTVKEGGQGRYFAKLIINY